MDVTQKYGAISVTDGTRQRLKVYCARNNITYETAIIQMMDKLGIEQSQPAGETTDA